MEREKFYFKEFAHVTAGVEKCNICRTGWQAGKGADVSVLSQRAIQKQNSFLFGGHQSFFLRPSSDYMKTTHITEGNVV